MTRPVKEQWILNTKFNEWYLYGKHKGIDLKTKCLAYPSGVGVPIYAAAEGEWDFAGYDTTRKGFGQHVILRHKDGFESIYAHLSSTTYQPGYTTVKMGDLIGYSGNTGLSTGPHLHFEVRLNGTPVDPMVYINAGQNLIDWARARSLLLVDGAGQIQFLTKNGLVELTQENCWEILKKNTWGIDHADFNDLNNLLK